MPDPLWGPIDVRDWQSTAYLADRLATEADVKQGRAVFFQTGEDIAVEPFPLGLPHAAILREEGADTAVPVVIIQAERAGHQVLVGYRTVEGGNGIATLPEFELLKAPDNRFGADAA